MSGGRVMQFGIQSHGAREFRRWYKRLLSKAMRRVAKKKIEDPETDLHPKRRFIGWD